MFADIYQDLSLDEEAKLPLPDNWIRTMRLSIPQGDYENDSATIVVYQDRRSGLETEEHPFITRALNEARLFFCKIIIFCNVFYFVKET
jgi:hypothetical protein